MLSIINRKWHALCIGLVLCNLAVAQNSRDAWVWHWVNKAGSQLLQPGTTYTNAFGEPVTIRSFKYYISHIAVGDSAQGFIPVSDSTYLISLADSESQIIALPKPAQPVTYIRFTIGVDSSRNTSGVQTGTLDPAQGMFWTWNSGYVAAKLEAQSPVSHAPAHYATYHVGGYKSGENVSRTVTLALHDTGTSELYIAADALHFFYGSSDIRIAAHPVCHEPGNLAMQLANNYAGMFSIITRP